MTADLVAVQRAVADALRRGCKAYNGKRPIIKVIAHEFDPRRAFQPHAQLCKVLLGFTRVQLPVSACPWSWRCIYANGSPLGASCGRFSEAPDSEHCDIRR